MGDMTRREAMKTALKMGAYAVPVIVVTHVPVGVAAATPAPTADLGIFITASPGSVAHIGDTILFTLRAGNSGPATATGVTVLDYLVQNDAPLSAVFTFVSATPSQGTYTPPAGGLYTGSFASHTQGTWNIGSLAVGQAVTLTLVVRLTATTTADAATYSASLSGSQTDPIFGNNLATRGFSIAP